MTDGRLQQRTEVAPMPDVTTDALRGYLFALSQFCRSVSDFTDEDTTAAPTLFHSVSEPSVDIPEYVIGVARRLRFSRPTVLLAIAYIVLVSRATKRLPSTLSIHRLLAATLLLAAKVRQEPLSADATYATAAGIAAAEIADLCAVVASSIPTVHVDPAFIATLQARLEVARTKTLRGDFTQAVAAAFEVPTPCLKVKASPDAVDTEPPSPFLNRVDSGASAWQPASWSTRSSFHNSPSSCTSAVALPPSFGGVADDAVDDAAVEITAGSASRAVRSLRRGSSMTTKASLDVTPPLALRSPVVIGTFPLPTFESQFDPQPPPPRPTATLTPSPSGSAAVPPSLPLLVVQPATARRSSVAPAATATTPMTTPRGPRSGAVFPRRYR